MSGDPASEARALLHTWAQLYWRFAGDAVLRGIRQAWARRLAQFARGDMRHPHADWICEALQQQRDRHPATAGPPGPWAGRLAAELADRIEQQQLDEAEAIEQLRRAARDVWQALASIDPKFAATTGSRLARWPAPDPIPDFAMAATNLADGLLPSFIDALWGDEGPAASAMLAKLDGLIEPDRRVVAAIGDKLDEADLHAQAQSIAAGSPPPPAPEATPQNPTPGDKRRAIQTHLRRWAAKGRPFSSLRAVREQLAQVGIGAALTTIAAAIADDPTLAAWRSKSQAAKPTPRDMSIRTAALTGAALDNAAAETPDPSEAVEDDDERQYLAQVVDAYRKAGDRRRAALLDELAQRFAKLGEDRPPLAGLRELLDTREPAAAVATLLAMSR